MQSFVKGQQHHAQPPQAGPAAVPQKTLLSVYAIESEQEDVDSGSEEEPPARCSPSLIVNTVPEPAGNETDPDGLIEEEHHPCIKAQARVPRT